MRQYGVIYHWAESTAPYPVINDDQFNEHDITIERGRIRLSAIPLKGYKKMFFLRVGPFLYARKSFHAYETRSVFLNILMCYASDD